MNEYPIHFGDTVVGTAKAVQAGLYKRFECRCTFSDGKIHRILMLVGEKTFDLGICVPEGETFVVRKQMPNKVIFSGELRFVVDQDSVSQHIWADGDPVMNIALLKDVRLCFREGKKTLIQTHEDQRSSSIPTGQ